MILTPEQWRARVSRHRQRLEPVVNRRLERASCGRSHPVEDFLFTYYRFPPAKLLAWHPGFGAGLGSPDDLPEHLLSGPYHFVEGVWRLDPGQMSSAIRRQLEFIQQLLEATSNRVPRHSCHGLHEWAMVDGCQPSAVRHNSVRLRLPPERISRLLRELKVQCSHYDAFRFFTPSARGLNQCSPCLESRLQNEQPGCVHTNMDLYKWCYKLSPWVGSDLLADAFELAAEARLLDMRASPYELREYGLEPVMIETEEGRREYVAGQKAIAEKAVPIRLSLLAEVMEIQAAVEHRPRACAQLSQNVAAAASEGRRKKTPPGCNLHGIEGIGSCETSARRQIGQLNNLSRP